ncbi:MAG: PIN domain-containing protein [Gemmatimonadota bacterium]|nr:MAG: PIN domain-containing protein [Gemmatimonadota bacterium]
MIAVDTNLLVYAHREDSGWHQSAYACVEGLAEAKGTWAIPWPCIHEFLAIVTHPRIYDLSTPESAALDQVSAWLEAPNLVLLSETAGYWAELSRLVRSGRVTGAAIHDARIAALCLSHGIAELWSADRDFGRFPELSVVNPLIR